MAQEPAIGTSVEEPILAHPLTMTDLVFTFPHTLNAPHPFSKHTIALSQLQSVSIESTCPATNGLRP
jgi:hypothetical protein